MITTYGTEQTRPKERVGLSRQDREGYWSKRERERRTIIYSVTLPDVWSAFLEHSIYFICDTPAHSCEHAVGSALLWSIFLFLHSNFLRHTVKSQSVARYSVRCA